MSKKAFAFTELTGGTSGTLDSISGDLLYDGNIAIGVVNGITYTYYLDDDSSLAESSPNVISPDTLPGTKRWILSNSEYIVTTQAAFDALASITTNTYVKLFPGTYAVSANMTIPAYVSLYIPSGVTITVSTTKTLTINGPFDAGLYQVFSCTGTGKVVFGAGVIKEAYPEWWGIDGTADQTEINAALTAVSAFHGVVRLQAKPYTITGPILYYTGTQLIGTSRDVSTGTLSTTITSTYDGYAITRATNAEKTSARLKDFKIILNSTGRTAMGGIDLNYASNCEVSDVSIFLTVAASTANGINIYRTGTAGGYYNRISNVLVKGSSAAIKFATGIKLDGDAGCNENVIDQASVAYCDVGIHLYGAHNTVSSPSLESINTTHLNLAAGTGSGNNTILFPYMDGANTSVGIVDNGGIGSHIIGPHFSNLSAYSSSTLNLSTLYTKNIKGPCLVATEATIAAFDATQYGFVRVIAGTNADFTVANPTNPFSGQRITIIIYNNCGGAMGTITWDTAFALGGAFTNPANGKYRLITFVYFGTKWLEESRTGADI